MGLDGCVCVMCAYRVLEVAFSSVKRSLLQVVAWVSCVSVAWVSIAVAIAWVSSVTSIVVLCASDSNHGKDGEDGQQEL